MKIQSGYFKNDNEGAVGAVNTQYDIAINSCGRYELIKQKEFRTTRTDGREDFQLLYIAKGKCVFTFNGEDTIVEEGNIVVYFPSEPQYYVYKKIDSPVVYWIHFSGFNALNFLKQNNLSKSGIYFLGIKNEISLLFHIIIKELQIKQINHFEMCNLYTEQLITLIARYLTGSTNINYKQNKILENALEYFNEKFNTAININEYANSCNISCCWFIRSFKQYTGTTPTQYITNIRINKAKNLLHSSSFSISEVSNLIGYQNPLYFSRIFKKIVGVAPMNYRIL